MWHVFVYQKRERKWREKTKKPVPKLLRLRLHAG